MKVHVPSLGEGVESGSVVSIPVSVGDKVESDQTLVEIETEKAVAPLPSPGAGTVEVIHVKEGDKITVGQLIVSLSGSEAGDEPEREAPAAPSRAGAASPMAQPASSGAQPTPGYRYTSQSGQAPPAGPAVRKLARELGLDLFQVPGSARGGRITLQDVKRYAEVRGGAAAPPEARPRPDFSKWGPVTKKPLSSIRQKIGEKMVESWTELPHVTQFADADITRLMELRKKYVPGFKKKGGSLTVTIFAIRAVLDALKKHPFVNASLDETSNELVLKNYFHIGIAVDTPAGLLVPVLKNVDQKSLPDLSVELVRLAEKARTRKITLDELQGSSFTISNLGSIGGTHFTPIINKPEVAILGIGRGSVRPVWTKDKFEPRTLLPLALSYDHRVVDGADGARFISAVVAGLENFDEGHLKG